MQARNWRIVALGNLVLAAGLGTGIVWQSAQSRVVPYVVEIDHSASRVRSGARTLIRAA